MPTGGYTAEWAVERVNVDTWADAGRLGGVLSVSVSRDCTDDVPLLETGEMELDGEAFEWSWCRVYMIADGAEKRAMATLLFENTSRTHSHGSTTVKARGRSVLQPAADRKMVRGSYAAKGTDGAARAGRLIADCTPAPVVVEGSFTLSADYVFDLGSTYLMAAWRLLDAGGWCIQVDGDGTIHVRPLPGEPCLELSRTNAGLLLPGIDDEFDLSEVPNRYYAVDDDEVAVAVNDDEGSIVSHASRRRWVDVVDEAPTLVDGETLEAYAKRKLAEASVVTREYTYSREWADDVQPFGLVRATLASNGVEGDLRVMRQTLRCGNGVVVEETAGKEVSL